MKVFYAKAIYDKKEINAVNEVLKNPIALMDGPKVKEFENKATKVFGKKFGLMVNSGSSANLLALAAFNFKKNSEIITPSLTFSTTSAPLKAPFDSFLKAGAVSVLLSAWSSLPFHWEASISLSSNSWLSLDISKWIKKSNW